MNIGKMRMQFYCLYDNTNLYVMLRQHKICRQLRIENSTSRTSRNKIVRKLKNLSPL